MQDLLLNSILIFSLVILVIEDFRKREISWPLVVLVFILLFIQNYIQLSLNETIKQISFNLFIVLIQLSSILFYIKLKKGFSEKVIDVYLGWGDLLLLIAFSPAFSPGSFLVFMLMVFLFTLIVYGLLLIFKINHKKEIPLAGIFALFFILHLFTQQFISVF